jgi:hypothetical protein
MDNIGLTMAPALLKMLTTSAALHIFQNEGQGFTGIFD